MVCDVCGREYPNGHTCPGSLKPATDSTRSAPQGFALDHYLLEALRIIFWDDAAIRRVMNDPRALRYGAAIWVFGITIPQLVFHFIGPLKPATPTIAGGITELGFALLATTVMTLLQLSLIHLVATFFCAGDGRFIQILRPLSLTSLVFLLQALPTLCGMFLGGASWIALDAFGIVLANIAWVCVMVMVFDVVDGMEQLTAFITSIAAVFGLSFLIEFVLRQLK